MYFTLIGYTKIFGKVIIIFLKTAPLKNDGRHKTTIPFLNRVSDSFKCKLEFIPLNLKSTTFTRRDLYKIVINTLIIRHINRPKDLPV